MFLHNLVLTGDNRATTAYFGQVQVDAMKYIIYDCHSGSDRRNMENIELSLSEIIVSLFGRHIESVSYGYW